MTNTQDDEFIENDETGFFLRWIGPNMVDFAAAVEEAQFRKTYAAECLADSLIAVGGTAEERFSNLAFESGYYASIRGECDRLEALFNRLYVVGRVRAFAGRLVRPCELK